MTEKPLMTSFLLANVADSVSTMIGFTMGAPELSPGHASLITAGEMDKALFIKFGISVALIGLYALSKSSDNNLAFSFEKSLQIANILTWGVSLVNTANILQAVLF